MAYTQILISKRRAPWFTGGNGYFYRTKETLENRIKLICTKEGCITRATVHKINGQLGPIICRQPHNHPPDLLRGKEETFRHEILEKSEVEKGMLRSLYTLESNKVESDIIGRVQYPNVCKGMQKRRKRTLPNIPENIPNLYFSTIANRPDLLETYDGIPFITSYNEENLMLISPTTARLLEDPNVVFCMDGTFKCTPRKPKIQQFFVLGGLINKTFIAIAFLLMETKTQEAYLWMLRSIQQHYPNWNPQHFISDFETGTMAAVRQQFGQARHQGCWFHYSQAIEKKAKQLGLVRLVRDVVVAKQVVKRAMALALLPEALIPAGFNSVLNHLRESALHNNELLIKLLVYIRDYWINRIGPERMSVADSENRTNNLQEAFNKYILLHTGGHHPNVWVFMEALKTMEHQMAGKLKAVNNNVRTNFPLAKKWKQQHERIALAYHLLDAQVYDVTSFLACVSHNRNFNLLEVNEVLNEAAADLQGIEENDNLEPLLLQEADENVDDPPELLLANN